MTKQKRADAAWLDARQERLRLEAADGIIEAQIALERLPTLTNFVDYVRDNPGTMRIYTWWKPWRVFSKVKPEHRIEIRLWRIVGKQARKRKLVQRDWLGHYWPYGEKPPATKVIANITLALAPLVAYLLAFGLAVVVSVTLGSAAGATFGPKVTPFVSAFVMAVLVLALNMAASALRRRY